MMAGHGAGAQRPGAAEEDARFEVRGIGELSRASIARSSARRSCARRQIRLATRTSRSRPCRCRACRAGWQPGVRRLGRSRPRRNRPRRPPPRLRDQNSVILRSAATKDPCAAEVRSSSPRRTGVLRSLMLPRDDGLNPGPRSWVSCRMRKSSSLASFALALSALAPTVARAQDSTRRVRQLESIVAVVGDSVITRFELQEQVLGKIQRKRYPSRRRAPTRSRCRSTC